MPATARKRFQADSFLCHPLLVLTALMCLLGCQPGQSRMPVLDFTLPQARGGVFHLRAEQSQAVVLAFLQTVPDASDTRSRQQVTFLESMEHQYGGRGLKVVIVDASALGTHQPPNHDALVNASYDWHLDIPLLEDDSNRVASRSGITEVPTLILLAPDGTVAERWHGLTGPAILAKSIEKICGGPSTTPGTWRHKANPTLDAASGK
jgi:peroxiredoxin